MAETLKNTGATLWSLRNDRDELQTDIFEKLTGVGGQSNIRLIDESIGDLNEKINTVKNNVDENSSNIITLTGKVDDNTSNITKNTSDISNNTEKINEHETAISTLNGDGEGSVKKAVSDGIAQVVAGAPEDFDTLKEMSDWISSHESSASAMNSSIKTNTKKISELESNKGDNIIYDENTNKLSLTSNGEVLSSTVIHSGSSMIVSNRQPTDQKVGDLWFVVNKKS